MKKYINYILILLFIIIFLYILNKSTENFNEKFDGNDIVITEPYAYINKQNLFLFMKINNNSNKDIKLTSIDGHTYEFVKHNNYTTPYITVPKNKSVILQPNDLRISIKNIIKEEKVGDKLSFTLVFDNQIKKIINVTIEERVKEKERTDRKRYLR